MGTGRKIVSPCDMRLYPSSRNEASEIFLKKTGKQALERGEQNKDQESKAIEMLDELQNVERVISAIHGGSKISGLTLSATKRHAREINSVNSTSVRPTSIPLGMSCHLLNMTCTAWLILTTIL